MTKFLFLQLCVAASLAFGQGTPVIRGTPTASSSCLSTDSSTHLITCSSGTGNLQGSLWTGTQDPTTASAPIVVQGKVYGANPGVSGPLTFTSNVTSGNFLLVGWVCGNSASPDTMTDTRSTTFTKIASGTTNNGTGYAFYTGTLGSSGSETFSSSGCPTGTYLSVGAFEISGTAGIDVQATQLGGLQQPSVTTTVANDVILNMWLGSYGQNCSFSSGSPEVADSVVLASTTTCDAVTHMPAATTGTYSGKYLWGYDPNGKAVWITAAVKPAAAPNPGNNGDFFLNTSTGALWGPKAGGAWTRSKFTLDNQGIQMTATGDMVANSSTGATKIAATPYSNWVLKSTAAGTPSWQPNNQMLYGWSDPTNNSLPRFVQANAMVGGSGLALGFSNNVIAGDYIIAGVVCGNGAQPDTVSDLLGTTFTKQQTGTTFNSTGFALYTGQAPISGADTIFTAGCPYPPSSHYSITIAEVGNTGGVDTSAQQKAGTTMPSITTGFANDLIVYMWGGAFSEGMGYSTTYPAIQDTIILSTDGCASSHYFAGAAGAYQPTITMTDQFSKAVSMIVAFKPVTSNLPGSVDGDVYLNLSTGHVWNRLSGAWHDTGLVNPTPLTGTASLSLGAINDGACATGNITVTGALTGDYVEPSWPSTLESGLTGTMLVTASNTVQARVCNFSGSTVTPATQTFGAKIYH